MLSIGLIPRFLYSVFWFFFYVKPSWLSLFDFFCLRFSFLTFCKVHLYRFVFFFSHPALFLLPILIEHPVICFLEVKVYVFGGPYLSFSDYGVNRYVPAGLYLLFLDFIFCFFSLEALVVFVFFIFNCIIAALFLFVNTYFHFFRIYFYCFLNFLLRQPQMTRKPESCNSLAFILYSPGILLSFACNNYITAF